MLNGFTLGWEVLLRRCTDALMPGSWTPACCRFRRTGWEVAPGLGESVVGVCRRCPPYGWVCQCRRDSVLGAATCPQGRWPPITLAGGVASPRAPSWNDRPPASIKPTTHHSTNVRHCCVWLQNSKIGAGKGLPDLAVVGLDCRVQRISRGDQFRRAARLGLDKREGSPQNPARHRCPRDCGHRATTDFGLDRCLSA